MTDSILRDVSVQPETPTFARFDSTSVPQHKSNDALTADQGLKLVRRLVADADFRARYEQKPAKAMAEIGIPLEQIINLPARCLGEGRLADIAELEATCERLAADREREDLSMITPQRAFPK